MLGAAVSPKLTQVGTATRQGLFPPNPQESPEMHILSSYSYLVEHLLNVPTCNFLHASEVEDDYIEIIQRIGPFAHTAIKGSSIGVRLSAIKDAADGSRITFLVNQTSRASDQPASTDAS